MKTLLKFAVGAAIAGALVNMLMKQRSGKNDMAPSRGQEFEPAGTSTGADMVADMVADTNGVGDAQDQRGPQPQDWRGAQNVSDS